MTKTNNTLALSLLTKTGTPISQKSKLFFLDGLRGIAALYVMIGHARWLLWEGYQNFLKHPEDYSIIDKIFMYSLSLFRYGHEFVLLFFVLSGFVIHYGYSQKLSKDNLYKFSLRDYIYRRARRIYPPFLFAIVLTFVLDFIGIFYNLPIYSGNTIYQSININVGNSSHSWETLFGNIFFLYKEFVPVFGTNGPVWSLKFEWWFYMLYPVFFFLTRKNILYSTTVVFFLFVLSFFASLWPSALIQEIFASMLCWWIGVIIADVVNGRTKLNLRRSFLVLLFGFTLTCFIRLNSQLADLNTAFLFGTLLALLLLFSKKGYSMKWLEKLKPIGDFSYTLYIIHFPILVLSSGFLMKYSDGKLPINSYFILLGILLCTIISYFVHFLVEVPFLKRGDNVQKKKTGKIKVLWLKTSTVETNNSSSAN